MKNEKKVVVVLFIVIATIFVTANTFAQTTLATFGGELVLQKMESKKYKIDIKEDLGILVLHTQVGVLTDNPRRLLEVAGSIGAQCLWLDNCISGNISKLLVMPSGLVFAVPDDEQLEGDISYPWGDNGKSMKISMTHGVITGMKLCDSPSSEKEILNTLFAAQKFDENSSEGVELSPNPFHNNLLIVPPKGCKKICIVDMKGEKTFYERTGVGNEEEILHTVSLAPGQYSFLFINSEGKSILQINGIKE